MARKNEKPHVLEQQDASTHQTAETPEAAARKPFSPGTADSNIGRWEGLTDIEGGIQDELFHLNAFRAMLHYYLSQGDDVPDTGEMVNIAFLFDFLWKNLGNRIEQVVEQNIAAIRAEAQAQATA